MLKKIFLIEIIPDFQRYSFSVILILTMQKTQVLLCFMVFHVGKEIPTQVFPCESCEMFKNTFFTEHLWATASVVLLLRVYWRISSSPVDFLGSNSVNSLIILFFSSSVGILFFSLSVNYYCFNTSMIPIIFNEFHNE